MRRRHASQQLSLPGTLEEAAQLHEDVACIQERLTDALDTLESWTQECLKTKQALAVLTHDLENMTCQRNLWKNLAEMTRVVEALSSPTASAPLWPPRSTAPHPRTPRQVERGAGCGDAGA